MFNFLRKSKRSLY